MAEIRSKESEELSSTLILDSGESIDLTSVNSSMVSNVGFSNDTAYIQYRDCIWSYYASQEEFDTMMERYYKEGKSIGKYVNAVFKPRGGEKILDLD